jgi:predicted nucleotidyltransferase component of viral defense system
VRPHTPAEAFRALQRRARSHGRGTEVLLVLYAHEAFLRRLSASSYRNSLVLKGGMLLAALNARRTTRDADLSAHGISNDEAAITSVVATISRIRIPDGVAFDSNGILTRRMRDDAEYHRVRVTTPASVSTARIKVQLDLSFGDPIDATDIEYPSLIDPDAIVLRGYPIELVLAEKIATMMARGEANTRDRDFADVVSLSRVYQIDADSLTRSLRRTAEHRRHQLVPLQSALGDLTSRRQSSWAALRDRAGLDTLPPSFADVVAEVRRFVDPIVDGSAQGRRWKPSDGVWAAAAR